MNVENKENKQAFFEPNLWSLHRCPKHPNLEDQLTLPGNSYWWEKLNTIDLRAKTTCFVKTKKKIIYKNQQNFISQYKEVNRTDPSL